MTEFIECRVTLKI